MINKYLIIFTIGLLVSGCYSNKYRPSWKKEGVTTDDTVSIYNECVYEVGMNKVNPEEKGSLVSACMKKNGFRYK